MTCKYIKIYIIYRKYICILIPHNIKLTKSTNVYGSFEVTLIITDIIKPAEELFGEKPKKSFMTNTGE